MAEIVTSILRISSILCTCNGNNTWCLRNLQENKDLLVTVMEELKDTRDDVKRRVVEAENNPNEPMKCNQEVIEWLERVQAIEGEVVQVLLKADKEIKGICFGGYCSINCRSASKTDKRVIQTLTIVKDFRCKGSSFVDVAYKLPPPLIRIEPMDSTVGMDFMFQKVWRLLAEDEVKIMGLYGQGGVGKTTLLKQINNAFLRSSSNTHGFDVVIFVVVSKKVNVHKIQKDMGDRLGLSLPNEENISNALSKKNFLLLLDDIWEKVDLQSIGIPPSHENTKSKIVFTTRSKIVCGLMKANEMFKVECLPWNEAWCLFQQKVGNETLNFHPEIPELAELVVRECDGLPLALITIGRAMSTKKYLQEWKHAVVTLQRSASEFPGMGDKVMPLLKLSYDDLPNETIKSCFLYCALYPEDESIYIQKLVDYWIGEGLISLSDFNHMDEARNHGHEIIGILKGASLLESGGKEKTVVKMNAMIRELALWIAHECGRSKRDKICIIDTSDLTPERSSSSSSSWYNNAERIYLITPPDDGETKVKPPPSPSPLKSPNLITLIHHHLRFPFLSVLPQNFFEFTPLLRVLDLSHINIETFPMSITELLELRHLSLSGTNIHELPEELGKLVKLNYLDLSYMIRLKKIPSGVIGSLLELRVLNLFESRRVDWDLDFDEVDQLKHLNDLGININTENMTKLLSSSNKNLQMCTRHLCIDDSLFFYQQSEDKPQSKSLSSIITIEKLQLLFNLETLQLLNMGIEQQQQQHHLGSSCFQNLIQIVISHCNGLKDLTWVGYVPNLKILSVGGCQELEEIVILVDDDLERSKGGGNEIIFKSLKTLRLWGLPKLKSICRNALAFPCLESLNVFNCPELKKLPFDSGSNPNNTLQKIGGDEEWWNELQWEDREDVKSEFLPYFIRNYGEIEDETINSNLQQKAGSMLEKALSLHDEEDDDEIRIIGLYGEGGVGKTTLLNQINKKFIKSRGRHGLDVVILVLVPKPINVETIQRKIGEGLKLPFEPDESRRTEEIFNVLRDKKFVLLLDDICERIDLRCIGVPFPQGKSKIVFTTRSKAVCQLMEADKTFKVECLPWDKAWSLFQEKVGEEALNSHPNVTELAEAVAKECGGLPLALVTIGRAMSTKKTLQEWNHAITTLRRATSDFPGMGDDAVLHILKLSYDSLHNDKIKSCFLYCALYPAQHSIPKSQLIEFWIGEEFFQRVDDIDEVRDRAFNVIESLQGAFLLESGEDDDDTSVKMHDVIRDLALWIVNEFGRRKDKSLVERATGTPNTSDKWENAERIYLSVDSDTNEEEDEEIQNDIQMETPPWSPNLLTLMLHGHSNYADLFLPQNFFQFMPLLRVLDFSELKMEEFPTSITELVELQYLGLAKTNIEALPDEMRKLVKLKYLDLSHTYYLRKIPPGVIASLSELRVFNQYHSDFGDWEEDGLSLSELTNLKHLDDLGITIETALALQILLRNRMLRMCTRRLTINECIDLKSLALLLTSPSSTATTLSLGNLKRLKELTCQDCLALEELTMNWAMVEDGQKGLLSNLETLALRNLPRLNVVWEKQYVCSSFQNLKEISIFGCNALKDLTWLVYVRNLEILYLRKCQEVEEILDVDGFGGGDEMLAGDVVFGRLKNIYLGNLLRLESICKHALAFPSLKSIIVEDCPHLKKLPLDCDSNVNNTLQRIEGGATWWNQLYWEDDHVKSMFLPYFIDFLPSVIDYGDIQDESIKSKFLPSHVQQKDGSMFEKAWSLLGEEDDGEIRIIGLYGQGGVGKTTLLNQINKKFIKSRDRHGLDVVILVLVPKPINVEAIQRKIGEGLKLPFEADESRRTEEIFNVLRDKKFVLLLDDICERIDLRCIGVPFPQGKSRIIFTTRSKVVCQLMEADKIFKVECLPWDKAWTLFQEKVGEEALNCHPNVAELAEVVAKECGGLPLALVTIGRAMSTKKTLQEWNHAITTLRRTTSDFPGMGDDAVLHILNLSYDSLHNDTIKSCFLYCALYPEQHSIPKSQLIDFWIGEEFFQWVDDIDEVRNRAFSVIESLQGAFLLESGEDDDDTSVKMHDVIRDLALWIVNEFGRRNDKSLVERATGTLNTSYKWKNAERIYLSVDIDTKEEEEEEEIRNDEQMETPPRSRNLLTLMLHGHSYYADLFLPQNFFQFMPLLRVLDFSELEMEEFPTSITELVELQYLGLAKTNIEALPNELRKLVNLKYLDLSHTYFLREIPPGVIASLSELRVFNQYLSDFGDWEEDGLSLRELTSLRHLDDLGITIETALALQRLLRNRKLRMCTRRLTISKCIDLKSLALLSTSPSSTATPLSLGNLKRLKELTCQNCSALQVLTMNWAMVEDGQKGLLSNLETLTLWNLPRLNVVWEKQYVCSSFQNLKEISIIGCNALKDLTWLVYVRNLEILYLCKCQEVEEILDVDGFGGGDEMLTGDVVFGRLKNIYLGNLLRLESICKHALAFPSLKSIVVEDCPHLKKLPLDCDSNVNNTLQRIKGGATWWNQLYWEDDHVKSMFLPLFR